MPGDTAHDTLESTMFDDMWSSACFASSHHATGGYLLQVLCLAICRIFFSSVLLTDGLPVSTSDCRRTPVLKYDWLLSVNSSTCLYIDALISLSHAGLSMFLLVVNM